MKLNILEKFSSILKLAFIFLLSSITSEKELQQLFVFLFIICSLYVFVHLFVLLPFFSSFLNFDFLWFRICYDQVSLYLYFFIFALLHLLTLLCGLMPFNNFVKFSAIISANFASAPCSHLIYLMYYNHLILSCWFFMLSADCFIFLLFMCYFGQFLMPFL